MSEDIKLARSSLRWARSRTDEFYAHSRQFIDSGAYQVIKKVDRNGNDFVVSFSFKVNQTMPDELSFRFGECIGKLRSPCDMLVRRLGEIYQITDSKSRAIKAKRLNFPVFLEPTAISGGPGAPNTTGFNEFVRDFSFDQHILSVLEGLQPYNTYVTPEGQSTIGTNHPLFILHELWNEDKHRMSLKITSINSGAAFSFGGTELISIDGDSSVKGTFDRCTVNGIALPSSRTHVQSGRVTGEGMEYARIIVSGRDSIDKMHAPITLDVILDKHGPIAPGAFAFQLLVNLHDFVSREVVDRLEPFFQ
jgi:hypothetical protein